MQISAEISRGIPAWKLLFLFLPVNNADNAC